MDKAASPWSVPVTLEEIPESGLYREIEAPAEARAAIAKLADLRALPQLSAAFDLTRRGAGVAVSGRVHARVGQTCVVTLEPIENTIDEPIEVALRAGGRPEPAGAARALDAAEDRRKPCSTAWSTSARWPPSSSCSASIPIRAKPAPNFRPPKVDGRRRTSVCRAGGAEEAPRRRRLLSRHKPWNATATGLSGRPATAMFAP